MGNDIPPFVHSRRERQPDPLVGIIQVCIGCIFVYSLVFAGVKLLT